MNGKKASRETDLDKLSRLKALSWLSPSELKLLASTLSFSNYKRHALILRDVTLAQDAHILISGIARITCRYARNQRVTVALLAPGPIPEFPALPLSQSGFQCEAYNDCRVGTVSWADFEGITPNAPESAFRQFHSNDLKQWYRLLLRSSSFLNLGLHERIAIALLELCSDFGIEESRGTLLRVAFSHKDIANLVDRLILHLPSEGDSDGPTMESMTKDSKCCWHPLRTAVEKIRGSWWCKECVIRIATKNTNMRA